MPYDVIYLCTGRNSNNVVALVLANLYHEHKTSIVACVAHVSVPHLNLRQGAVMRSMIQHILITKVI